MKLLGIVGKARCGKDTVADQIIGNGYVKRAFADPIYRIADEMFGIDSRNIPDKDKETVIPKWGLSLRQMLQIIGTEMGRDLISQDIWLKRMDDELEHNNVVISDIRFDNEAMYIKKRGGLLIHVTRDTSDYKVNQHVSELGVTNIYALRDHHLDNNGSLKDLETKVSELLKIM